MNYTSDHIKQYLSGGLSPAERHALEKAALQDPLLADAMEGFAGTDEWPQEQLNSIRRSLDVTKEEATVPVIVLQRKRSSSFGWVAAALLLSGGLIALSLYTFNRNNNQPETVALRKAVVTEPEAAPATTPTDSVRLFAQQASPAPVTPVPAGEKAALLPKAFTKAKQQRSAAPADQSVVSAEVTAGARVAAEEYASDKLRKAATAEVEQPLVAAMKIADHNLGKTLNGRILNQKGQPVADAALVDPGNKALVGRTDAAGYFSIRATTDSLPVMVDATNYDYAYTTLRPGDTNRITVAPSGLTLSEMVVTNLRTKKKEAAASLTTRRDTAATPKGGWQSFQEYVNSKLARKMDTTIDRISRDVEIEFLVDENGKPYNYRITRSVDAPTDRKALEILKNGPAWIASPQNKKGRVTIQF
jgi:hypothetical protein